MPGSDTTSTSEPASDSTTTTDVAGPARLQGRYSVEIVAQYPSDVDAYELVGRREDAVELFEELLTLIGPTGLLAEEYDPRQDRSLGNVPQAYSHLGVIQNALRLDGR